MDAERLSSKEVLHTLFHILGRYHEHERPDRDKYVQIIEENIIEGIVIIYILHIYMHVQHVFLMEQYSFEVADTQ